MQKPLNHRGKFGGGVNHILSLNLGRKLFNTEGNEEMRRISLVAMLTMGLLGGAVGCDGGKSDYKKADDLKKAPAAHDEHEHGHDAKGPHGGSLIELGADEYHAELVLDHDAHALRVFVLGSDAKTDVPTTATEVVVALEGKDPLTLKAAPQEGDGEGKSSRFELIDEKLIDAILDSKFLHGDLRISIGDKPFSGHIHTHLEEAHHEHKDDVKKDEPHKDDAKPDEAKKDATPSPEKKEDAPKDGDSQ